jgi:protein O-mannosyl-transferase
MIDIWSTAGLLDYVERVHQTMPDRAFGFVLGAGSSRQSGIPTGRELVDEWLKLLHRRYSASAAISIESWATTENLGIDAFEYRIRERFYPQVFERTFRGHADEGYAFLESVMVGKEPSLGYSILAQILARGPHSLVVSTNFDNLVGDALALYTRTYPFVCGHESLTEFVRPRMRRPLIAKIHRDLLLGPQNRPGETKTLAAGWDRVLRDLLRFYTPIVLGYGGNDGTLMGLLEGLDSGLINGRLCWCFREQDGTPDERILAVVERHRGVLVPILGFDEFMVQLGERLGLGLLTDEIMQTAQRRAERYTNQFAEIIKLFQAPTNTTESADAASVRQAIDSTLTRTNDVWAWYLRADREIDLNTKEEVLREGMEEFPRHPLLLEELAEVFWLRGQRDEAERHYREAVDAGSKSYALFNDFGLFLSQDPKYITEARAMLERAIRVDGNRPNAFAHLAAITLMSGDIDQATYLAERAWVQSSAKRSRAAVKAALVIALGRRLQGASDMDALGRLKRITERSFDRGPWPFGLRELVDSVAQQIDPIDVRPYQLLADALESGVISKELATDPRWAVVDPIKLTESWEWSERESSWTIDDVRNEATESGEFTSPVT